MCFTSKEASSKSTASQFSIFFWLISWTNLKTWIVCNHYKCWVATLAPGGPIKGPHALFCKNLVIILLWTYSKSFLEDKTNLILCFENANFCTDFVPFSWDSVVCQKYVCMSAALYKNEWVFFYIENTCAYWIKCIPPYNIIIANRCS